MKMLLAASAAACLAVICPDGIATAHAADLDDHYAYDDVDERYEPRVIVRERIIVREYIAPRRRHHVVVDHDDIDDDDVVIVRRPARYHVHDAWNDRRIIHGPGYRRVYYRD